MSEPKKILEEEKEEEENTKDEEEILPVFPKPINGEISTEDFLTASRGVVNMLGTCCLTPNLKMFSLLTSITNVLFV